MNRGSIPLGGTKIMKNLIVDSSVSEIYVDGVLVPLIDYRHILEKIITTWGTQECLNYMIALVQGTDRAPRYNERGFLPGTKDTLLDLIKKHPTPVELKQYRKGYSLWESTTPGNL